MLRKKNTTLPTCRDVIQLAANDAHPAATQWKYISLFSLPFARNVPRLCFSTSCSRRAIAGTENELRSRRLCFHARFISVECQLQCERICNIDDARAYLSPTLSGAARSRFIAHGAMHARTSFVYVGNEAVQCAISSETEEN